MATAASKEDIPRSSLVKLRSMYTSLRPAERSVADAVLSDPLVVVRMTISDLSKSVGVADSTIVRFCKALGYSGYQEFKLELARDTVTPVAQIHEDIVPTDSPLAIAQKIFASDRSALEDTLHVLDGEAIRVAVEALANAKRIDFYGVGSSGPLAVDAFYRFLRIGLPASAYTDSHMMAVAATTLTSGMVAFGISHTGSTLDTLQALTEAKQAGAFTICLTSFASAPIVEVADVSLVTACRETAFRTEAMASRIAQLSMIDALYAAVAIRRFGDSVAALERSNRVIAQKRL